MMKSLKFLIAGLLIASIFVYSNPRSADAQDANCTWPGCFGGYAAPMMTYCTCSGYYWMVFSPIYFYGMPTAMAAAMSVPPVVDFMYYATGPAIWYTGTYIPGLSACYMYLVYGCYQLPSYGTVINFTGTSLPGAF
jgi:hypothetical protein